MKISILGLAEWMMTLKNGGVGSNGKRILSEESIERMFQKEAPDATEVFDKDYGLTLTTSPLLLGFPMRGHIGSAYGLRSCLFFSPEQDFGIVIYCSSVDGADGPHGGGAAAYCEAAEVLYTAFIRK